MEKTELEAKPVLGNQPEQKEETPSPAVKPSIGKTLSASPKSNRWPVILLILLVLLIIAGGILFAVDREIISWGTKEAVPTPIPTPTPSPEARLETEIAELEEQSPSDEIRAIENDLDKTDFSNLDQELTEIESELATP